MQVGEPVVAVFDFELVSAAAFHRYSKDNVVAVGGVDHGLAIPLVDEHAGLSARQ